MQADYQSIAESIANIAELKYDPKSVAFELNVKLERQLRMEKIKRLNGVGMLPTEDQLRDTPFWNEDLSGIIRNCPLSNNDNGVFDILGEYFPIEKKIVVYTELCHLTALRTGLRYDDIIAIVIAHEASMRSPTRAGLSR